MATDTTALKLLAADITKMIEKDSKALMLNGPLSLTVSKKSGDFTKRPHIGGEWFKPVRCYVGKRNSLIYVFNPTEVADYTEMEMTESQAKKSLSGFQDWLNSIFGSDFQRMKRETLEAASREAERERMATRPEYEALGFGTW